MSRAVTELPKCQIPPLLLSLVQDSEEYLPGHAFSPSGRSISFVARDTPFQETVLLFVKFSVAQTYNSNDYTLA